MTRKRCLGIVCVLGVIASSAHGQAQTGAASAAVKASPALVGALAKEIGATPEQAAGAAGALFSLAKSRLTPPEFSQVAAAVPGMDALLRAAPAAPAPPAAPGAPVAPPAIGTAGTLPQLGGSAGGLASAATAFSKLGLKPDMVGKAVPVLTSLVTKSGGASVGKLLADALK